MSPSALAFWPAERGAFRTDLQARTGVWGVSTALAVLAFVAGAVVVGAVVMSAISTVVVRRGACRSA